MNKIINSFPGYECVYSDKDKKYHNIYRETDVGMGGYVFASPNMYGNVALLDVQSMHPASLIAMNCFGEYTKNFQDLRDARVAIKHGDFDKARKMLDGKLAPFLEDESTAKDLAQALKICINSVFGLTAAKFDNPMRDIRNKNNIVACRGALTMRTLQDEVSSRGFVVAHIKTDSIKIPDASPEIIQFVMDFGKKYGYIFEHEATYDRMCLVNNAVYIAKYATAEKCEQLYGYVPGDNKKHGGEWTATGAQFQQPYVYKKLFTHEPIEFADLCEVKEVSKGTIYLDRNEKLPDGEHDRQFIGRIGNFCPIKPGYGGAELVKEMKDKEGNIKYDSVSGAKDYRWLEAEMVKTLGKEDDIDISYYTKLVDDAVDAISKYGDFEWFVSDDPYIGPNETPENKDLPPVNFDGLPWTMECGRETCEGCPHFNYDETQMACKLGYDISDLIVLNSDEHCIVYDSCDSETLKQYRAAMEKDAEYERNLFNKR